MKRQTCKTRRLILRPLENKDFEAWYDAYVNGLPKQNKWDRKPMKPSQCTRKMFHKIKKEHESLAKNDDYYRYYVIERKTNAIVGLIDFDVFVRGSHQFANFGYQIFNRHWKKGYGKEASLVGLKIGFQQLRLNRLEAAMNLDNKASLRLAKSIGMKREGIKKRYWFEYGKWTDHLIYIANPEDIGLKPKKPYLIKK
ncbi:MAG: GNAT family N-acetyltransferase [Pseudobdellovibrionaceae bacterium]